jgi:hypothetical protein
MLVSTNFGMMATDVGAAKDNSAVIISAKYLRGPNFDSKTIRGH